LSNEKPGPSTLTKVLLVVCVGVGLVLCGGVATIAGLTVLGQQLNEKFEKIESMETK